MKPKAIPAGVETYTAMTSGADGPELLLAKADESKPSFVGNLVPWWTLSDRGTYFVPGSAKKTIKEAGANAPHLYQHDPWTMIGKHSFLEERDDGLYIGVDVNEEIQSGHDVMSNLRFGIPSGLSVGMDRVGFRPGTKADDKLLNRATAPAWVQMMAIEDLTAITEFKMWESSTVTWGALATAKTTEINAAGQMAVLIEALREGTLSPEELASVKQIVAAKELLAGAAPEHSTDDPEALRKAQDEEALLLLAGYAGISAMELIYA